ncbi:EamA family transporter [Candidatus Uabimicrobium amorphum]|uniref:Membrane protein n=1 Tax=Uabimicrobium amorphum TaxID=2596890 RepID=A0A5S9IKZ9_UABAM|nr:EamA family transporter [Candidatus Uabimicrobium amorphum]BBM83803.1 membrane protein [Candidatus Uabimicrobium amorphum]
MHSDIYLLVFLSAFMHALWNLAARKVKGDMGVLWLSVLLATLVSTPVYFLIPFDFSLYLSALPYIIATGVIHAFYFIFLSKAYEEGHISFVYPIARGTGVAGTAILAFVLLNEQISLYGGIAIAAILCGTITMALGNFTSDKKSALLAFSVGVSIALYSIVDKLGVQKIHPAIYIAQMFLFSILLAAPYVMLKHKNKCLNALRKHKKYIAIVGCGSISTYALILFAFRLGHVSYIVALRECSVVLGAIFGILFFKEHCNAKKVMAITMIVCGVILLKMG